MMFRMGAKALYFRREFKRVKLMGLSFLILAALFPAAQAQTNVTQTNLDYWVQELKLSLTATTNGPSTTNGIIAHTTTRAVRFDTQALLQAINGKTVMALNKALTNFSVVAPSHTGAVTNQYTLAYFALAPAAFTNSTGAKIVILGPLGSKNSAPIVAVRPNPAVAAYYSIDDYLRISPVAFDARTNETALTAGRIDISHDLVSTRATSIRRFIFNSNTATNTPPTGAYFDVQGFTTELESSLIEKGQVIDVSVSRGAVSSVAGSGQFATNSFSVLRGTIALSGGKHEVQ